MCNCALLSNLTHSDVTFTDLKLTTVGVYTKEIGTLFKSELPYTCKNQLLNIDQHNTEARLYKTLETVLRIDLSHRRNKEALKGFKQGVDKSTFLFLKNPLTLQK